MEQFIYFFLFYYWFCDFFVTITKLDSENSPLRDWAANKKGKIGDFFWHIFDVCRFCLFSHLGFLLSIPIIIVKSIELYCSLDWYLFIVANWYYFFFGYMATALKGLIEQFLKVKR